MRSAREGLWRLHRQVGSPRKVESLATLKEPPGLKLAQQAWLAAPGQGLGAKSSAREGVKGASAEGGGRALRKRTHVEYAEEAQPAQAVRRAAEEEARRRKQEGHTGVRVGRTFQAAVPDWAHGKEATAPGPGLPADRNDKLQLASFPCAQSGTPA